MPSHAPRQDLAALRAAILSFYRATRRDLPWRRSRDPYAIWVSEIMLQQTQVDTVVPRYGRFLAQFPDVAALAAATEHAVCEAWAGLGYYRRARHLHAAARQLMARCGGQLPADVAALQALPGIGRYTAGAIASIAFGLPAPLVDGNVVRVLSRVVALVGPADRGPPQTELWALATALVEGPEPGDFNQGLMELGAVVCTPTSPACGVCPARPFCRAHASGQPTRYPTPPPRPKRRALHVAFAWAMSGDGVWLAQRPLAGLWAGLWELPSAADELPEAPEAALAQRAGALRDCLAQVDHTLTHRQVTARVWRVVDPCLQADVHTRVWPDPLQAPLSALARKAIVAARLNPAADAGMMP